MGEHLVNYYKKADELGGLLFKMRLAVLTGIPSGAALLEPDSAETIKKFDEAMKEIEKQFAK